MAGPRRGAGEGVRRVQPPAERRARRGPLPPVQHHAGPVLRAGRLRRAAGPVGRGPGVGAVHLRPGPDQLLQDLGEPALRGFIRLGFHISKRCTYAHANPSTPQPFPPKQQKWQAWTTFCLFLLYLPQLLLNAFGDGAPVPTNGSFESLGKSTLGNLMRTLQAQNGVVEIPLCERLTSAYFPESVRCTIDRPRLAMVRTCCMWDVNTDLRSLPNLAYAMLSPPPTPPHSSTPTWTWPPASSSSSASPG